MKLKLFQAAKPAHSKAVTALGWTSDGELYSAGEDQLVVKGTLDPDADTKPVAELGSCPTALKWCVTSRGGAAEDTFAVACTDGTVRLMGRNGRVDRSFTAHEGAVTCLAWNHDGTALATGGEDGAVMHWSQQGNLRSKLAPSSGCVYALAWAPNQQALVVASGEDLVIKPLVPGAKETSWRAHQGAVLCVDWSPINDLIVSGGEDCTYKVWDAFGRVLFQSSPLEFPITSIAWAPSGALFAAGSFESLVLCDRAGWSMDRVGAPGAGSFYALDWARDGTALAAAGAAGGVARAEVLQRRVDGDGIECVITGASEIEVRDVALPDAVERLEVSGRIVDASVGYGHLVVATTTSLCIYPLHALASPYIVESRGVASFIVQGRSAFAVADPTQGLRVLQYDGKLLCSPRLQGVKPELLSRTTVALGDDVLVVVDLLQRRRVHVLDVSTGKPAAAAIVHDIEVAEIGVNQAGLGPDRKVYLLDKNRDLHLAQALKGGQPGTVMKLLGMVDSACWHATQDLLAAVADGTHSVFICPGAYFQDRDIAQHTRIAVECGAAAGKMPRIVRVSGQRTVLRRIDGAAQTLGLSPFPALLARFAAQGQWAQCVRLCRSEKTDALWAALSVYAVQAQQVDVAELAFAALEEADKVEYMQHVRALPSAAARAAELLLYSKRPDEAERALLHAGLVHRAIKLNIRTFQWARALQLALQYKAHIDTVVAYRTRFLEAMRTGETDPEFRRVAPQVTVDWAAVQAREEQELEQERARGQPYHGSLMSAAPGAAGAPMQASFATPPQQMSPVAPAAAAYTPVLNSSINPGGYQQQAPQQSFALADASFDAGLGQF